jgi:hypothetical protein
MIMASRKVNNGVVAFRAPARLLGTYCRASRYDAMLPRWP